MNENEVKYQSEKAFGKWVQSAMDAMGIDGEIFQQNPNRYWTTLQYEIESKIEEKASVNPFLILTQEHNMHAMLEKHFSGEVLNELKSTTPEKWIFSEVWLPFKDGSLLLTMRPDIETQNAAVFFYELLTDPTAQEVMGISANQWPTSIIQLINAMRLEKIIQPLNPSDAWSHFEALKMYARHYGTSHFYVGMTKEKEPVHTVFATLSDFLQEPELTMERQANKDAAFILGNLKN